MLCLLPVQGQHDIHIELIIPSLSGSSQQVTNTLEMNYKADAMTLNTLVVKQ